MGLRAKIHMKEPGIKNNFQRGQSFPCLSAFNYNQKLPFSEHVFMLASGVSPCTFPQDPVKVHMYAPRLAARMPVEYILVFILCAGHITCKYLCRLRNKDQEWMSNGQPLACCVWSPPCHNRSMASKPEDNSACLSRF